MLLTSLGKTKQLFSHPHVMTEPRNYSTHWFCLGTSEFIWVTNRAQMRSYLQEYGSLSSSHIMNRPPSMASDCSPRAPSTSYRQLYQRVYSPCPALVYCLYIPVDQPTSLMTFFWSFWSLRGLSNISRVGASIRRKYLYNIFYFLHLLNNALFLFLFLWRNRLLTKATSCGEGLFWVISQGYIIHHGGESKQQDLEATWCHKIDTEAAEDGCVLPLSSLLPLILSRISAREWRHS